MGLGGRKPLLPAPTESLVDESTVEEPEVVEEVATDLSQRSDRTHHTIPEDGSPITISTAKPTSKISRITKSTQNSQTSLLIEYFEAGKGSDPSRRPSVRVKVIPSSKNKTKVKGDGEVVLTGGKKGTSRRFSVDPTNPQHLAADSEISILDSLHIPESHRNGPLDIEIQQGSDISSMGSRSPEARYIVAPSDISSMPGDSMLGVQQSTLFAPHSRVVEGSNISSIPAEESVMSGSELHEITNLKPPVIPRERNASSERITQKVIEKLSNRPREGIKTGYGPSSKSTSRSASRDVVPTAHERVTTKPKTFRDTDSTLSPTEPSLLSASDRSARSVATNNSINNPKLLQTVEDAIRRLILPELKELKKDQRQHSRSKYDTYSDLSENSVVREKSARRSTSGDKIKRRKSSKEHGEHSGSRRRKSVQREFDYDSMSDTSSRREGTTSSISEDPKKHKSHRARDMAAAGLVGAGLTAAALEARDSEDSLHQKRRRKRSKSRSSRSASLVESEEIFHKHKVPPMPMQSDINSELTRSSILSSNTATSHTPTQQEVRQIARDSPREVLSPINTPPRHSGDMRSLGMHHGNFSEHNLSSQKLVHEQEEDQTSPETDRYQSFSAEDLLEDPERMRLYERNLHTQHPIRRGLSPIQSVASYQTEQHRHSMLRKSADSLASMQRRQQQLKEEVSISSFTSASPDLKKPRPQGINLENRSEIMHQHEGPLSPEFQSIGVHDRFGDDHDQRDSYAASEASTNNKRFSGVTDASSDFQPVDKLTAGQHVVDVHEIRPEVVPVPWGVESGVASLVEPSVLSQRTQSPQKETSIHDKHSSHSLSRDIVGSPLKNQVSGRSEASPRRYAPVDLSPPQSPARSYEEQREYGQHRSSSHSPLRAQNQVKGSPESEITTNPSVIHGPIGGLGAGRADPWTDQPTPTMPSQGGMSRDFSSGAIDLIPEGLNVNQRHAYESKPNTYVIGGAPKDEGYATGEGDNYSPQPLMKTGPTDMTAYDFDELGQDPFTTKKNQYISGFSQGMSPLYEPATGKGVENIQSRDIVHLMEHLTVRDAQRNARDTEILVTLVRTAAEMRNNFEEMKAFISEQDEMILDTADKQHAQTQKVVGGPRQMPPSRPTRGSSQEDLPTKRRNVFKRALQGLGSKNTAELQNIESMLMQLLDEVEALRSEQATQPRSIASEDAARPPTDTGYEPEGRAGTASSGGSAFFSNNTSRQGYSAAKRVPENRVSTVMEEDYDVRTPRAASPAYQRGHSEPLHTPPRMHDEEYTPTTLSSDKKKTFSSFLPNKFVSRWSKTTASTEPESRKQRPYSGISRSGSDLQDYQYEPTNDDRLRSATSLPEEYDRPPSPLVPSAVSEPKYQAHRNSQNMQHPQPRQGPTGRYQYHLENAAVDYPPMSPVSQASQHIPRTLSPISDTASVSSITRRNNRPPRPPKVAEDPLVPQRPPKLPMSPSTYVDDVRAARAGSPSYEKSPNGMGVRSAGRKPSGPRPLSASSNRATEKRARFTNSPAQSIGEEY